MIPSMPSLSDTLGDVFSRFHPSGGLIPAKLAPKTAKNVQNGEESALLICFHYLEACIAQLDISRDAFLQFYPILGLMDDN